MNSKENFFEQLYLEYSDQVYSYVFLMVRNAAVSEDITQDTFVQVYRKLDTFQQRASISTWIISIARNRTIDYIRKQKKFIFFSIEKSVIKDNNPTPAEIIEKGEAVVALFEGIKQLKWEYQEILILRKIKELSMEEASQITGWSISKVKSTTTRALAALRKVMKKEEERL
ncbi:MULTISPECIES: RNA polymerase sigma factor [Bacillus]|uniref:RNA polymerase sigma factor n=1 Tax=Bacillus TaxID=1386 RepID=UPI000BB98A3A|nr:MULTISPECIES: RNA polymerase sigma factor [Bacillus]